MAFLCQPSTEFTVRLRYIDATTEEEKRINDLRFSRFGVMEEYLRSRDLEEVTQ